MTSPQRWQTGPAEDPTPEMQLAGVVQQKAVRFAHLLRAHGFAPGLRETHDTLRIAELFLCFDFDAFHVGLRALFCNSLEQIERFDELFNRFWRPRDATEMISPRQSGTRRLAPQAGEGQEQALRWAGEANDNGESHATSGATDLHALRRVDFSRVPIEQSKAFCEFAARLYRRMRVRSPSRLRGRHYRRRLHFRRIIRRSLATGGEPIELIYEGRRRRRPSLVVLLDVSGSMEVYSQFFLHFLHAVQQRFRKVNTFLFSTQLEDVTTELESRNIDQALAKLARRSLGWNAGTKIGACLADLVRDHGERVFRADTVFVILSDGLDVGEPEQLTAALRKVRMRARSVIWLNPLMGTAGYEPTARGMAAARPLVDVLASAHDLQSLLALERHIMV